MAEKAPASTWQQPPGTPTDDEMALQQLRDAAKTDGETVITSKRFFCADPVPGFARVPLIMVAVLAVCMVLMGLKIDWAWGAAKISGGIFLVTLLVLLIGGWPWGRHPGTEGWQRITITPERVRVAVASTKGQLILKPGAPIYINRHQQTLWQKKARRTLTHIDLSKLIVELEAYGYHVIVDDTPALDA